MKPSTEKPFCLADFDPFLRSLGESEDHSVVIGGMAVSAWAEMFLEPSEHSAFDLPIYSKDLDLRGQKTTCILLAQKMQLAGAEIRGVVAATRKSAPHMGRVFAVSVIWRGFRTSIEVLERLPGLDSSLDEPEQGRAMAMPGGFAILDPCSLFICKLNAANGRTGDAGNNDIKHLAILARVIPRFLAKLRSHPVPDYDGCEDARRLLLQIDACRGGEHPFRIPLPDVEVDLLTNALREHLSRE